VGEERGEEERREDELWLILFWLHFIIALSFISSSLCVWSGRPLL
jgi:hypothetical protein